MNTRRKALFLLIVLAVLALPLGNFQATAQSNKQVWVFYIGYWTPAGWDQRANVLTDYPLEKYNSADGGVAARQIEQAQSAGIDAFIVSWFGPTDGQTTAVLNVMLDQAAARGFHAGAAIDVFAGGANATYDGMVAAISYLVYDRSNHPAWVRYNGKPVIHFAFQENTGFTDQQWQDIRNAIDPAHNTIWVAEGLQGVNGCCLHGGAFDGAYAFNVAWGGGGNSKNSRSGFFHPTVHPGWDETLIAAAENRPNPTSPKDRANGGYLRGSWNSAVGYGTDVILIVSWNEFMENSHIEPSVNYGSQSLEVLAPLIARWKGVPVTQPQTVAPANTAAADPAAVSAQQAPANPVPGVRSLRSNGNLNVRAQPDVNSEKISTITPNEVYPILGEANGFFLIQLADGRQGYVAAAYVTVIEG